MILILRSRSCQFHFRLFISEKLEWALAINLVNWALQLILNTYRKIYNVTVKSSKVVKIQGNPLVTYFWLITVLKVIHDSNTVTLLVTKYGIFFGTNFIVQWNKKFFRRSRVRKKSNSRSKIAKSSFSRIFRDQLLLH